MPKQVYKIDQFHGGLNSNADPRDIADNELSESKDLMEFETFCISLTINDVSSPFDLN